MTSIIIATKDSQTLNRCLESIHHNTSRTETPFEVILVNSGEHINSLDKFLTIPGIIENVKDQCLCLVEQFNYGFKLVTDFFVAFPDDHIVQPNWLKYSHEDFKSNFPDGNGFLVINEGIRNGSMGELVLTRKSFINNFCGGVYFDPRFKHFRCSPELYDRAKLTGKTAYSERSKIKHAHTNAVNDDKANYYRQDKATYKAIVRERDARK